MPKLIEVTAEQYDCLRELGVPVCWRNQYSIFPRESMERSMAEGGTMVSKSCDVASLHTKFYTLIDGDE